MKRVLFVLIALILFAFIGSAQGKNDFDNKPVFKSGSIITSFNKEVIEYKFKFFDDLNEEIKEIIGDFDFSISEKRKEVCEIAIEIKIEIDMGDSIMLLSEKIISNCTEEILAIVIKRLKVLSIATAI
jgi:hypothetical protein